jgi:hypothetical protein
MSVFEDGGGMEKGMMMSCSVAAERNKKEKQNCHKILCGSKLLR